MERLALISVADKRDVVKLAVGLRMFGYSIVSTGGTAKTLLQAGVPVTPVEGITRFVEMLDGRVKTLHPAVHGGILARRDLPEHMATIEHAGINPIDIVVVNLYPFRETIARPGATDEEAIEQIDIGGPAMVRSAAKNHDGVVVVVEPEDYDGILTDLTKNRMTLARRRQLAAKAFAHTSAYDAAITAYLSHAAQPAEATTAPESAESSVVLTLTHPDKLRYGENPHQSAERLTDAGKIAVDAAAYVIHQGKELSYNNLVDADAAWAALCDLPRERANAVIVKHANPCGVGSVVTAAAGAILRAFDADPISAFGGILAVDRTFDLTAAHAVGDRFLEVILAPSFEPEALELLAAKPNLRVVSMGTPRLDYWKRMLKSTVFGVLSQDADNCALDIRGARIATKARPTDIEWQALDLLWRVCKHVKSNAIVIGDETGTLGVGAGQMSRVDSAVIAVGKARKGNRTLVAASDAFFPFADGVETLIKGGVKAIVQPGGSKRDAEVIAAADAAGISMVMTDVRHFRH